MLLCMERVVDALIWPEWVQLRVDSRRYVVLGTERVLCFPALFSLCMWDKVSLSHASMYGTMLRLSETVVIAVRTNMQSGPVYGETGRSGSGITR